jgi:hypothetical protein
MDASTVPDPKPGSPEIQIKASPANPIMSRLRRARVDGISISAILSKQQDRIQLAGQD